MRAQGLSYPCTKTVGLDQDGHQFPQFRLVGTVGEATEGVGAALARAHFERHQRQFLAQLPVSDGQFLAHVLDRLVETHAGFD